MGEPLKAKSIKFYRESLVPQTLASQKNNTDALSDTKGFQFKMLSIKSTSMSAEWLKAKGFIAGKWAKRTVATAHIQ